MATLGMTFRRLLGALMTCSLLGLAGCADADPAPQASPPSAAASPTPSTSPSPTEDPRAETAEEFIRRWPVVETEMINTGQTDEYLTVTKGCQTCSELAEQIEGFYAKGGYAETDGWEVRSIRPIGKVRGSYEFSVVGTAAPTVYRTSRDGQLKTLDGGKVNYRVYLERDELGWRLADYLNEDRP